MVLFYLNIPGGNYVAAAVFVLAALTDILDGEIARRRNIISDFGKLMDPIADKMLVTAALVILVERGYVHSAVAIAILTREFVISGYRAFAASKGIIIPAGVMGKLKTVVQIVAITALLICAGTTGGFLYITAQVLIYIAVLLTIVSGVQYLKDFTKYNK